MNYKCEKPRLVFFFKRTHVTIKHRASTKYEHIIKADHFKIILFRLFSMRVHLKSAAGFTFVVRANATCSTKRVITGICCVKSIERVQFISPRNLLPHSSCIIIARMIALMGGKRNVEAATRQIKIT